MEKKENSQRIQTSLLNPLEKKALLWMGERTPRWVTSDMLTYFGLFGAILITVGYALTNLNPAWLWLSNLGFFFHWVGDSMDGTIARIRKQQRPLYGFYIDHNMDCITEFFIFGGMGLSAYMNFWVGLMIFAVYLAMEVYVMINAHLKNEFKLTYAKMGPTEFRVVAVLVNTFIYFCKPVQEISFQLEFLNITGTFRFLDIVGIIIFVILFVMYISSLVKDGKYFAQLDPLHKTNP